MTRQVTVEFHLYRTTVRDEHLAVDADRCKDGRQLQTADVVYGTVVRRRDEAEAWLWDVVGRMPAWMVAATPVVGGLWAARCRPYRAVLYLAAPPEAPVGSCLHAWMVAGRSPEELA